MEMISNETMLEIELDMVRKPTSAINEDWLHVASQYAFRSMLRPKGTKKSYYQNHFDGAIEQIHDENPLISRALLARLAVNEIVIGNKFPCAEDSDRQAAREILDKDFIAL